MKEQSVKTLNNSIAQNRIEQSPTPIPKRRTPHRPWDVDPENAISSIPEDPDDVPDDEDISIGSKMEVIE